MSLAVPVRPYDDVLAADLLSGLASGDHNSWREVMRRYQPFVRSAARSNVQSAHDVDEASQRTWTLLHRHASSIRDVTRLAGWLSTTARREALAIQLARKREVLMDDIASVETRVGGDVGTAVVNRDEIRRLRAAIDRLPSAQARLMTALLDDSNSYDDISTELGIARGTVGPMRARAVRALRQLMQL